MRVVGLDIHRVFAEAVMLEDGKIRRLGRIGMTRDHLAAFARSLTHDDHVVIEATGNASAVAEVIRPHVGRVVIANPRQVRLIAEARIKTDVIDATVLARLYASGFLPEVWVPDEAYAGPAAAGDPAQPDRASTGAAEDDRRSRSCTRTWCRRVRTPICSGPKGRAWLLAQPLPPDEQDAVERHLREHDRLERGPSGGGARAGARRAAPIADTKRLMTIPGIDMVVAVGLLAAIGPIERFAGPDDWSPISA